MIYLSFLQQNTKTGTCSWSGCTPRFCVLCADSGTKRRRTAQGCRADKTASRFLKKRMEWRNGVFRGCVCSSSRCSGARWLDLSNRLARTAYHSRLVLSTLNLQIFSQSSRAAGVSAVFSTFCPKNSLSAGRKPTCFLLLFKTVLAIIVTQDFVGRFLFLSTPCSKGCRRRQCKTVSPPENRPDRAVFQWLVS